LEAILGSDSDPLPLLRPTWGSQQLDAFLLFIVVLCPERNLASIMIRLHAARRQV